MRTTWLALVVMGCTTAPTIDPATLQMNDISILLPLPQNQAELAATLALSTPGRDGALVPEDQFTATTPFAIYDRFRATALRVDPCFGAIGEIDPASGCHPQIRLVFQPLTIGAADDMAVHAFYQLTVAEVTALVGELAAARRADGVTTDLGPLAIHPVLAREGLTGSLAQAIDQIVAKYAGAGNLEIVNTFAIEEIDISQGFVSNQAWQFTSSNAGANLGPRPIAMLGPGVSEEGMTTDLAPLVTSTTPSLLPLSVLSDTTRAHAVSGAEREDSFDAALEIESPRFTSPTTTDCVSCHIARPAIELVGAPLGLDERDRDATFVAPDEVPRADLARTTKLIGADRGLDIHAFSYRGAEPMINQRTINETAANLAYFARQ